MEEFSSSLLDGALVFGKYPTNQEVSLLKENGYYVIVDLCPTKQITWTPYNKEGLYYSHLPIPDRTASVGDMTIFNTLISRLSESIRRGYKVYYYRRSLFGWTWKERRCGSRSIWKDYRGRRRRDP